MISNLLFNNIFQGKYFIIRFVMSKICDILLITKFHMGKEYQDPLPPLAELREKAEALEKLSAERSALAKRLGIAGTVQAHTSLETAERVGRVRAKLELSSEIFSLRATALHDELEAYEKAPAIMADWQRRGEEFTALSGEYYRGNVKKIKFIKAFKEYKAYVESIKRHLPTMRGIERRRQQERHRQESQEATTSAPTTAVAAGNVLAH
ncbi:MAG: hypothetical protein JO249_06995 [Acidobacteria bacterium]|nr:hypothetical protein [Acidobacteriota bacterium]